MRPPSRTRPWLIACFALLTASTSVIATVHLIGREPRTQNRPRLDGAMTYDRLPADGEAGPAASGGLPGVGGPMQTSDLLRHHGGDKAFDGEPADLPPMPGASRTAGLERVADGFRQVVVLWELPAGTLTEDVLSHYREAGVAAGFRVLRTIRSPLADAEDDANQKPGTVILGRSVDGMFQTLTIRANPAGDGPVKVTLILDEPLAAERR